MFELPNAKRVKRSKLFSSFSSSENEEHGVARSPEDTSSVEKSSSNLKSKKITASTGEANGGDAIDHNDIMNIDYGFVYDFVDKVEPPTFARQQVESSKPTKQHDVSNGKSATAESQEKTFAFNLFAPKPTTTLNPTAEPTTTTTPHSDSDPSNPRPQPTLITIRSPTPPLHPSDPNSAGDILTPRPQSHYFTSAVPPTTQTALRTQYTQSAISGTAVLSLSTSHWPGTHLPWRTIPVPRHKLRLNDPSLLLFCPPTSTTSNGTTTNPPTSRTTEGLRVRSRPSKKRRIHLRQRLVAREALKTASQRTEEEEREKRTRRNREKKVKRKMREKAKKAEGGSSGSGDAGANAGADAVMEGEGQGSSNSD